MVSTSVACSQCGWTFDTEALQKNTCKKCKSAILVTSIAFLQKFEKPAIQKYIAQYSESLRSDPNNPEALLAMGICYLKLHLYDLADTFLARLVQIEPTDPRGYFYRAVGKFRGKRPSTAVRQTVQEVESLLDTATQLDPANGRYDYIHAHIVFDYYARNGMRPPGQSHTQLLEAAKTRFVDELEVAEGLQLIGMTPAQLA